MGFIGINRVHDSDGAADAAFRVGKAIAGVLNAELKSHASGNNTPGYMNVALIFEELIAPSGDVLLAQGDVLAVIEKAQAMLVVDAPLWNEAGYGKRVNVLIKKMDAYLRESRS
jgi:hypothetical protein